MKKFFCIFCVLALLLAGCGKNGDSTTPTGETTETTAPAVQMEFSQPETEMFTERDDRLTYDEATAVTVELQGNTAKASSGTVKIEGATVTLTQEATYIISGNLDNGTLIVAAGDKDKVQLVLNGAHIHNETMAALYIRSADKVFVTTAQGSENSLTSGETFTPIDENNIDGALFSKQDLTLNGYGLLEVASPGGHGIVCKDDLVITSGKYTVSAAGHGFQANDSIRLRMPTVSVTAGKDGFHTENDEDETKGFFYCMNGTYNIVSEGDGISAGAFVQLEGGNYTISAGGGYVNGTSSSGNYGGWGGWGGGGWGGYPGGWGSYPGGSYGGTETDTDSTSMKGIKGGTGILVNAGTFTIDAADDGFHSNKDMAINGGTFSITSGDDGLHAEDTLTVTAGDIEVAESYEGLEALHLVIQGGNIQLTTSDDGLNAAGGTDNSGTTGGRDGMYGGGWGGRPGGGGPGGPGGPGGLVGWGSHSDGSILISGGTLMIHAQGDGLDANGTLEITGGHTTVVTPTQGDTSTLDFDVSGVISGGFLVATGTTGMSQTPVGSGQGVISVRQSGQQPGTPITVTDSQGNVLLEHTPDMAYMLITFSCPELVPGETYTVTIGTSQQPAIAN